MADSEKEESLNLQIEFEWILHEEVHAVLKQLHAILIECAWRFPVPICGNEIQPKQEKHVMSVSAHTTPEQVKCVVALTGDSITHADISLKVQKQPNVIYRTSIQHENPWKLQQVQDAGNHLQQAILHIENVDKDYVFRSSEEVLHTLGNILGCLQRGRSSLIVPRKKTIDDLMNSRNMSQEKEAKSLVPNLPENLAVSFYIQSHKLIFAVYHVGTAHGAMKFDTFQSECSLPWLSEVLVLFTVGLQMCQQLKDKICVFSQYKDFSVESRSTSAMSW